MSFKEYIVKIDQLFFVLINNDSQNSFWDHLMIFVRTPSSWIPLYVFMVIFFIKRTGKSAWLPVLFSLMTFVITDIVSVQLKETFDRLRPCADPAMAIYIREIVNCGGLYSFPSSHAANHFGLATFWYFFIRKITGSRWHWLWAWAALVCYAQVYVGKHFPIDVFAGAILGFISGMLMQKLFFYFWNAGLRYSSVLSIFQRS
jgi:undecaprenyl-diphosphatase